jgi:hypothetical protein
MPLAVLECICVTMSSSFGPRLFFPPETLAEKTETILSSIGSSFGSLSSEADWDERHHQLLAFCFELLWAVQETTRHWERLDRQLSTLLPNIVHQYPNFKSSTSENLDNFAAKCLLQRLPSTPQKVFAFGLDDRANDVATDTLFDRMVRGRWLPGWCLEDSPPRPESSPTDPDSVLEELAYNSNEIWSHLCVTNFMDTNSLIFLTIQERSGIISLDFSRCMQSYLNILAELLDGFDGFSNSLKFAEGAKILKAEFVPRNDILHDSQRMNIVRAFLWTAWQRSTMLHFNAIIARQLQYGSSSEWSDLLAIRGVDRLSQMIDSLGNSDYRGSDTTSYLCNWSLELLRRNRSSLCLDFRYLIRLFDNQFSGRTGRCIIDSDEPCPGDQPSSCQRFTSAETLAQSAHGDNCDGKCERIRWNETSYRQTQGSRAVFVVDNTTRLEYCVASRDTLAVTHVWAHGQGGRPEEGINHCLHDRYSKLARKFDCNSYWIDAACIPTDETLRKEAISNINSIFTNSKAVLLSDADIQSVDIREPSIEVLETVTSILLLCDWNVRAWTFLEATRANRSIQILCKHDATIPSLELLRRVLAEGSLELAVLIGGASHLLPAADGVLGRTIEDSGYTLSLRHASRPGDDVVIWSLLHDSIHPSNIVELWGGQKEVRTGFLMSSAPRVKLPCRSWAQSTPTIKPQIRRVICTQIVQHYTVSYHGYDGRGSLIGRITPSGLQAKWFFMDMDNMSVDNCRENYGHKSPFVWSGGESHFHDVGDQISDDDEIYDYPDVVLACEVISALLKRSLVRLVRPVAADGKSVYSGGTNRGDIRLELVAICSSDNNGQSWLWEGVYQWAEDIAPTEEWGLEEMLLV